MYREPLTSSEVHTSHCMSQRFRVKREERIWNTINDPILTAKIELRNNIIKGVQQ